MPQAVRTKTTNSNRNQEKKQHTGGGVKCGAAAFGFSAANRTWCPRRVLTSTEPLELEPLELEPPFPPKPLLQGAEVADAGGYLSNPATEKRAIVELVGRVRLAVVLRHLRLLMR